MLRFIVSDLYPNYYNQFSCLGSKCVETCCQGWKIDVDEICHKKYEELERKYEDDKIERFLKKNTNPTNHKFSYIEMKKNGFCPFLDKSKLCTIQKKFGEDYLPNTCKTFPRRTIDFDEIKIKTLSLACPEAARLCLTSKNSMEMKSGNKDENNFLKIVPSYLHNSFTIVGEKLFNKIYLLFKDEGFDLKSLLIICESILNEQKNLERNPEKIDEIFNFIVNKFRKIDFPNYDKSKLKINFLSDVNTLIQNTNPDCSLNELLSKAHKELVEKNSDTEKSIINFKNVEKNHYLKFEKVNYRILRNYFLNEILGHAQIFTNELPNCRNRFYLTILCAVISKLITIGIISEKNKKLDNQILINAIQKVAKNFGAFVIVDSNHEYEFHPEIFSALKKIDKNSIFNSLFLLFS